MSCIIKALTVACMTTLASQASFAQQEKQVVWEETATPGKNGEKRFTDNTDYDYRGTIVNRLVSCESRSGRTQSCDSGLVRIRRIYLNQQLSRTQCSRNNVTVDRNYIVVSGGCRAVFEVEGLAREIDQDDHIIGDVIEKEMLCESVGYRPEHHCPITGLDRVQGVWLSQQISRSPCIENQTYFIERSYRGDYTVRVTNGCRAYFKARGISR